MDYGAEPKTSGIEQSQPQQGKRTIAIALLNDRNRKKEINGREEKRVLHCCTYLQKADLPIQDLQLHLLPMLSVEIRIARRGSVAGRLRQRRRRRQICRIRRHRTISEKRRNGEEGCDEGGGKRRQGFGLSVLERQELLLSSSFIYFFFLLSAEGVCVCSSLNAAAAADCSMNECRCRRCLGLFLSFTFKWDS